MVMCKKKIKHISVLLICFSILFTYTFGAVLPNVAADDFEASLLEFPESYRSGLRALHEKYPNWVFNAQQIPLDWNVVVTEECVIKRSLVARSSPDSWKSFEENAFDFNKNDWIGLDGNSWVAASKEIIMYYLDPRNFLNESSIYMFLNHSYDSSTQNLDGIKNIVKGTFLDASFPEQGFATYSDVILDAATKSRVSPYVLAASIIIEQGTSGSSALISGSYPGYVGYYNYFNINAAGEDKIARGLWYAAGSGSGQTTYNRPWNTRAKSIVGGALFYGTGYVDKGQNNLYFKKFDVVNESDGYYWHQYMTNIQGAESEALKLKNGYKGYTDTAFIFNIPVYSNMPSTAAQKPVSSGNNNNLLKSLGVEGYEITPSFTKYRTNYDLIVDKNTYSITIKAETIDSGAVITSSKNISLKDGNNTVPVVVTASSGVTRTYQLNVFKQPNSISSQSYNIDRFISNVLPNTSVSIFNSKFTVSVGSIQLVNVSGSAKVGNVATGDKLQLIQDNAVYMTYDISVNGDTNGDGDITPFDLLKIQKHILNIAPLTDIYLSAADYNKDGKVTPYDCLLGQKYILKL